jgi:GTP cyclohydrolase I
MTKQVDLEQIKEGVRLILEGIGEDPERAGFAGNSTAGCRDVRRVDVGHA